MAVRWLAGPGTTESATEAAAVASNRVLTFPPLIAAAAAATLITAPPARADVLVHSPDSPIACGEDITVGVWYQAFSGGPRWARIYIESARKYVLAQKRVHATTRWRYWHYTPR